MSSLSLRSSPSRSFRNEPKVLAQTNKDTTVYSHQAVCNVVVGVCFIRHIACCWTQRACRITAFGSRNSGTRVLRLIRSSRRPLLTTNSQVTLRSGCLAAVGLRGRVTSSVNVCSSLFLVCGGSDGGSVNSDLCTATHADATAHQLPASNLIIRAYQTEKSVSVLVCRICRVKKRSGSVLFTFLIHSSDPCLRCRLGVPLGSLLLLSRRRTLTDHPSYALEVSTRPESLGLQSVPAIC